MTKMLAVAGFMVLLFAGACLDEESTDPPPDDGDQSECVPFLTCGLSTDTDTDETDAPSDDEDDTWDCIPFLTCEY